MIGRRIVIHHCKPGLIQPGLFTHNDILFFDDCLLSQYYFIKNNIENLKNNKIILGFSSGLARPENFFKINFLESDIVHQAINKSMKKAIDKPPPEIGAFMSVNEIKTLLQYNNIQIALHGCVHLKLENIANKTDRLMAFKCDTEDGMLLFNNYGFQSQIFVYPYAFYESGYNYIVKKYGFLKTYACPDAYRISIESILNEHTCCENS